MKANRLPSWLRGVALMPFALVAMFREFYDLWRAREAHGRAIDRATNPGRDQ